MSAPDERVALHPRPSLYTYALRLRRAEPDGLLPKGGYPLPDPPPRRRGRLGWQAARTALGDLVPPLLTAPDPVRAADELHRRLDELGAYDSHVQRAVAELPLEDEATARAVARRLVRVGSSTAAVTAGLALLARVGERQDVRCLMAIGLLRDLTDLAVHALAPLDLPAAALLWLARHGRPEEVRRLVDALAAVDHAAVRTWLRTAAIRPRGALAPSVARRVAEAVRLDALLRDHPADPLLLAQGAALLERMTSPREYRAEILDYRRAVAAYEALVARADRLPATLDHYALLLSLAVDLHSGPSFHLDWRPGRREALLDTLEAVLSAPAWAAVAAEEPADPALLHRARWIRRTARIPFARRPGTPPRLRIEVAVPDPAQSAMVETRFLIDGRPLVPEAFREGPGDSPAALLDRGLLRATEEPRDVRLAEAYCTEGCCGALHVTVSREGDEVVWGGWRRPAPSYGPRPPRELPEIRFDAAEYDAEVARAERDRSWVWPAWATARLIGAGLRERPGLLTRWDAESGRAVTDYRSPDTTEVYFTFRPGLAAGREDRDGPWLQFVWRIPEDGTPPEERAAAALHRLATSDPKTYAQLTGGTRAEAERLGIPWPENR
ncbi:hypothetical protein ACFPM3_15885 [Streptomyces coeruleoprunus]|uniref:Uncharacterized protein n=1 Tax=Streptomyces coeruleoprunus TaxID=285563 RepID=A0ABV9XF28_9ACTN